MRDATHLFKGSSGADSENVPTGVHLSYMWGGKQDSIITTITYQGSPRVSTGFYLNLKTPCLSLADHLFVLEPFCVFLMNEVISPSTARQSSEELEREQELNL